MTLGSDWPNTMTLPQCPSLLLHAGAAAAWVEHRGSRAAAGAVPAADGLDKLMLYCCLYIESSLGGRPVQPQVRALPLSPHLPRRRWPSPGRSASEPAACGLQARPVSAAAPPMSQISGSLSQLIKVSEDVCVSLELSGLCVYRAFKILRWCASQRANFSVLLTSSAVSTP